jgi:hypothetical protein
MTSGYNSLWEAANCLVLLSLDFFCSDLAMPNEQDVLGAWFS